MEEEIQPIQGDEAHRELEMSIARPCTRAETAKSVPAAGTTSHHEIIPVFTKCYTLHTRNPTHSAEHTQIR